MYVIFPVIFQLLTIQIVLNITLNECKLALKSNSSFPKTKRNSSFETEETERVNGAMYLFTHLAMHSETERVHVV